MWFCESLNLIIRGSPGHACILNAWKIASIGSTIVDLIFFFGAKFFSNILKIIKVLQFHRFFHFKNFVWTVLLAVLRPACRCFLLTFAKFTCWKRKAFWFWWKFDKMAPPSQKLSSLEKIAKKSWMKYMYLSLYSLLLSSCFTFWMKSGVSIWIEISLLKST